MTRHSPVRAAALSLLLATGACGHFAFQDPGIVRPGLNVAEAALRSGSGQIALQVSDNVLRDKPDNVAALEIKADALTLLGSLDEAAAIYETLLAKSPDSTRATIGLGRIKLTKDPAAAEALFQRVLKHDPNDLTALNNLGIARDLQGRHPEAQAAYRQALAIDAALTSAQVNMALSLAMSGRGAEAVKLLKPAASEPGASVKVKHDYAVVLAMAGQRAEAERVLAENLPPEEVRQVLDSVTGTHTARGLAPDRGELNRATTQASRNRGDTVPADVVQPIPAQAMGAPRSAPPPEVVRPRLAEAQERGTQETGTQVTQPVDPVAAGAANPRSLSAPLRALEVPAAAPVLAAAN